MTRGALTPDELLDVWKKAVDEEYARPILQAGEGQGLEVHTQLHAQLVRVSQAIERTSQAMYLCPWSGQTDEHAMGARKATVTLKFTRSALLDRPLWIQSGSFLVEEETTDWGVDGGVVVTTGMRYAPLQDVVFQPGDVGPFEVPCEAEFPGYGYNNPFPETIRRPVQIGAGFSNAHATVAPLLGTFPTGDVVTISTLNRPDTFIPDHIGQYVALVFGANVGQIGRIRAFRGPNLALNPPVGSFVDVDRLVAFHTTTYAGAPIIGETFTAPGDFRTTLITFADDAPTLRVTLRLDNEPTPVIVGTVFTGSQSGATFTVETLLHRDAYVAEAPIGIIGGATWEVLPWSAFGLTITNELSPVGGRPGWLDELGAEKNLPRHPGEDDEMYRMRLKEPADVVSPNAIRRALYRVLGSLPWCFREVGTLEMPGFFYDGDNSPPHVVAGGEMNDAYDAQVLAGAGGPLIGTFIVGEAMVYEDAAGWTRFATGAYLKTSGPNVFMAMRTGGVPSPIPVGGRFRGLLSNATFGVSSFLATPFGDARNNRRYLDYAQFRGFFQVCVPRIGADEFGVAYDTGAHNAFDVVPPVVSVFDGYAAGDADIYGRVWSTLDEVKAAGVEVELALDCEDCT